MTKFKHRFIFLVSFILILAISFLTNFLIFADSKKQEDTIIISVYDAFSDKYIVKNTKTPISNNFSIETIMTNLVSKKLINNFTITNNKLSTITSRENLVYQTTQSSNEIDFILKKNSVLYEQKEPYLIAKDGDIFELIFMPIPVDKTSTKGMPPIVPPQNNKPAKNYWTTSLSDNLNSACDFLNKSKIDGDLYLITMGIAGKTADMKSINALQSSFKNKTYMETKLNISQTVLAATFSGFDANIIEHGELVSHLSGMESVGDENIFTNIHTLLAYDSNAYPVQDNALNSRQIAIKNILQFQKSNGGFSNKTNEKPALAATAFAITALSTYKDEDIMQVPLKKALEFLSQYQTSTSKTSAYDTADSLSNVIIALNSMQISLDDARFKKENLSLIDSLLSFQLSDGSFSNSKGSKTSLDSTKLAIIALSSIKKSANPFILTQPVENSTQTEKGPSSSSFINISNSPSKTMIIALMLLFFAIAIIIVSHKLVKRKNSKPTK